VATSSAERGEINDAMAKVSFSLELLAWIA